MKIFSSVAKCFDLGIWEVYSLWRLIELLQKGAGDVER
jgi:hypothetical protein